jgi:hypothetical protein
MRAALRECRVVEPPGPQCRCRVGRGVGAGRAGAYGRGSGRGRSRVRRSRPSAGRQAGNGCSVRTIGRLGWAYASAKERHAPPQTAPPRAPRGRQAAPARDWSRGRRPPVARGRGAPPRRRAGPQPIRRARACTTPRQRRHRRHGPAAADSRDRHTPRADTDISRSSPPTPDPAVRPVPIPNPPAPGPPASSASPRRFTHRLSQHPLIHSPHATPARCRRPPPTHQHPPGLARPGFTWTVEEGGQRNRGGPPSSKAQAQSGEQARGRGGGVFAHKANP